jgi:hypothetical protein
MDPAAINHIALNCGNLAAQEAFFSKHFGFQPAIAPALRKLRGMLKRDAIDEAELIEILRESSPGQSPLLSNFEAIPARTAELCLERWPVILEMVQSMRHENSEERHE